MWNYRMEKVLQVPKEQRTTWWGTAAPCHRSYHRFAEIMGLNGANAQTSEEGSGWTKFPTRWCSRERLQGFSLADRLSLALSIQLLSFVFLEESGKMAERRKKKKGGGTERGALSGRGKWGSGGIEGEKKSDSLSCVRSGNKQQKKKRKISSEPLFCVSKFHRLSMMPRNRTPNTEQ